MNKNMYDIVTQRNIQRDQFLVTVSSQMGTLQDRRHVYKFRDVRRC